MSRCLPKIFGYYVYRCVVKNDFSETITDEVTLELLYAPYFYDVKGLFYLKTETTHEAHWGCCGMVEEAEPHALDEKGVCKVCQYGCKHTGGTANCMESAHCEKCGDPYDG